MASACFSASITAIASSWIQLLFCAGLLGRCVAIWQLHSMSLQRSREIRGERLGSTVAESLRSRGADNRCRLSKIQSNVNSHHLTRMLPQNHRHRGSPPTVVYFEPAIPSERSNNFFNGLLISKIVTAYLDGSHIGSV